jgi:hypothetical protein
MSIYCNATNRFAKDNRFAVFLSRGRDASCPGRDGYAYGTDTKGDYGAFERYDGEAAGRISVRL